MVEKKQTVVIIGGGITGITAAYYLQKKVKVNNLPLDVKLIEASHRLGGKAQTLIKNGFIIERGPDSFLERKTSAARLAKEVGMTDKLVNNASGKSYVLAREKLHPIPEGSFMGIPTQITPFITTGLFSFYGKLRAAGDFILPRSEPMEDQALGEFFRRRLGDEVVENLIEPLLSGIYAGDIDHLSLMATFPNFYYLEQKYRSLVLGIKKTMPTPKKTNDTNKKGIFLNFSTGIQSFIDAIEAKLDQGTVLKSTRVNQVTKNDKEYLLELNSGKQIVADSVVVATPHYTTIKMFSDYPLFSPFEEMPATSVANVALAFSKDAIEKDINGTGFVVSRNTDYSITACTWTHKKWPHSTPEGKVLLRCYVGRPGHETIVDLSDDQIIKIVLEDLNKTMNITSDPEFAVVTRWKDSMPQYTVGHKQRLESVKQAMKDELPGVFLAGSSYEGIGLPDCIDQGEAVVDHVLNYLNINIEK